MVRAFIGTAIPEDIKSYVSDIQQQLMMSDIDAKFVEPKNLHISLSFLGDVDDRQLENIIFKLDEISKSYKKFEITIDELQMIPNENFVRVIALGVKSVVLENLRKEIVDGIDGKSHEAHLTLARVKSTSDRKGIVKAVNGIRWREMSIEVGHIHLIKSVLGREGPVYTIIHDAKLG